MLNVKFWGTRGSIPTAQNSHQLKKKMSLVLEEAIEQELKDPDMIDVFLDSLRFPLTGTYGGNSSCIEIDQGQGDFILCDFGSGAREFAGHYLANGGAQRSKTFHVFMSHLHWDHIMGFPFFTPAYIPGHKIIIYGCHDHIEDTFRRQHSAPNFPVDFSALGADIEFRKMTVGQPIEVEGITVDAQLQLHEGDSYGYRFRKSDKSIVYSTDSEHKVDDQDELDRFVEFIQNADLVVFDAMYSLLEAVTLKEDWGHSSNLMGVELCLRGNAKTLCLFHHDPIHSDQQIYNSLLEAESFAKLIGNGQSLDVIAAHDGLCVMLE